MRISKRELAYLRDFYGNRSSRGDRIVMCLLDNYAARGERIKKLQENRKKMETERNWLRLRFSALKHAIQPIFQWWRNIEVEREIGQETPYKRDDFILHSSINGQMSVTVSALQLRTLVSEVDRCLLKQT